MKFLKKIYGVFLDLVFGSVQHTYMGVADRGGREAYYRDRYNRRWLITPGFICMYRSRSLKILRMQECYIVAIVDKDGVRQDGFNVDTTFHIFDITKARAEIEARIEVSEYKRIIAVREAIFPR